MVFHFFSFFYSLSLLPFQVEEIFLQDFQDFQQKKVLVSQFHQRFLFHINSPVASAALWTTLLKADFRVSSFVLVAVSHKFFPYLLDRFLANDKNPYPLTYFLIFDFVK